MDGDICSGTCRPFQPDKGNHTARVTRNLLIRPLVRHGLRHNLSLFLCRTVASIVKFDPIPIWPNLAAVSNQLPEGLLAAPTNTSRVWGLPTPEPRPHGPCIAINQLNPAPMFL